MSDTPAPSEFARQVYELTENPFKEFFVAFTSRLLDSNNNINSAWTTMALHHADGIIEAKPASVINWNEVYGWIEGDPQPHYFKLLLDKQMVEILTCEDDDAADFREEMELDWTI